MISADAGRMMSTGARQRQLPARPEAPQAAPDAAAAQAPRGALCARGRLARHQERVRLGREAHVQGLTLVHFSAQRQRLLWDWGCV